MSDEKKLDEFKSIIIDLEKESLANVNQTTDQQMISKIIKAYEEFENEN